MKNVLLIYPENPKTFWSYERALAIAGRKSMFPPTGLLTIAGMLPPDYNIKLIDQNVTKLKDSDIAESDVVLISAMGIHKNNLEKLIARINKIGTPIMVGGPLPTQYYDRIEGEAVFFLGEAEAGFVEELDYLIKNGYDESRKVIDRRKIFKPLTETPMQRFDLLKGTVHKYQVMAVQLTRGCPESCTFCNIGSLFGKQTRLKDKSLLIKELDALYKLEWNGSVMMVDDNVAGNQQALLHILKDVEKWQKKHNYPFSFFTQASLRIYDNKELMEQMYRAGFNQVFFGIESPSIDSLKSMAALKNIQGLGNDGDFVTSEIQRKLREIQSRYFKAQAGFIIGFDKDPDNISDMMVALIENSRMGVAMVGPLGILPDTADYRKYSLAGRLVDVLYTGDSGMFTRGLSYIPHNKDGQEISPDVVTDRVREVLERIYSPKAYFSRTLDYLKNRERKTLHHSPVNMRGVAAFFRSLFIQGVKSNYRKEYWKFLWKALRNNPKDISDAVSYAVEGHHLITVTKQMMKVDDVNQEVKSLLPDLEEYVSALKQKGSNYIDENMEKFSEHLEAMKKKYYEIKRNVRGIKYDFRIGLNKHSLRRLEQKYSELFGRQVRVGV
ncbi:MAG: B12-binding domain-containing radical SAM protein [Candidatus Nanoarchaeia archaeon]